MNGSRIWLFRVLVLAALGLMLISWFMDWWSADVEAMSIENAVIIHPFGLEVNHLVGGYVEWAAMPGWFAPLAWTYLGLATAAILIGTWIKDTSIGLFGREFNLSKLFIGIAGFSYIVVVIVAVAVMAIRSGAANVNIVGKSFIVVGPTEATWISARFLFGYWLACGVGPLLIVLALLRDKIIGRPS